MIRILPVFFSLKKMRPSGANLSETGKLRPVRMVVTGEEGDDWARENIQGPIESMIKMTIFINNFRDGILRGM